MICYVFILTSFACNAKSFAIACLVFFFRFVLPCNAKKLAIAFLVVVFSPFLSWRVLERDWQKFFDQCFIICYLESVCPDSDLIVWHAIGFHSMFLADLSESMWNIAPHPLKALYLDNFNAYCHRNCQGDILPQGAPIIMSHGPLITWSYEIRWQTKTIKSPLPQCLWLPNLVWWRLTFWGLLLIKLLDPDLARSRNKLKPLYLHYHSAYGHQNW